MIMAMTLLPKSIFCNYGNEMNYVFLTDEESFMGSPWPGHQNVPISFEVWFSNRKAFYDNTKHSLGLSRRSLRPHKLVGFIIWRPTVDLFAIRVHILVWVLFRNIRIEAAPFILSTVLVPPSSYVQISVCKCRIICLGCRRRRRHRSSCETHVDWPWLSH